MQGTAPDLRLVGDIVRRHLPSAGFEVFLFGSRASGSASERSDWDIGILGPVELDGHVLQEIHEELESLPTLHTLDLVDLRSVSETFRRKALSAVVPL